MASSSLLLLPLAVVLRLDLAATLVGSVAGIAAPTTAAAFAAGRGWSVLVTPAVLTGVLGFGISTFMGLAVFGVGWWRDMTPKMYAPAPWRWSRN